MEAEGVLWAKAREQNHKAGEGKSAWLAQGCGEGIWVWAVTGGRSVCDRVLAPEPHEGPMPLASGR